LWISFNDQRTNKTHKAIQSIEQSDEFLFMGKLDSSKIFKRRSIKLGRIARNGNIALAHTSSIAIVLDSACCSPKAIL
jgi:hypothetical protein